MPKAQTKEASETTKEKKGKTRLSKEQFFEHLDTREVVDNIMKLRKGGGYDAFVIGNSLDVALVSPRNAGYPSACADRNNHRVCQPDGGVLCANRT